MRTQTARGALVMVVGARGAPLIRTLAFLILARLLDPEDFGLVSMAMILLTATDLFAGLGLGHALIHTKADTRGVAFPLFVVTALSGAFLSLIIITQAEFFARFLGDPQVVPILRVLPVMLFLTSLSEVPEALLRKKLTFNPISLAQLLGAIVANGLAIGLALLGFGVWSLVGGELARAATRMVTVWAASRSREWLRPKGANWTALRGLFRYGIQSWGSGLLAYVNTNWDDWLVGRVLGSTALGFYGKAYHLTNRGISDFHKAVSMGVLFPSFAKIQDDKERVFRIYPKSMAVIGLMTAPLAMGLLVIAPEAVAVVLGDKWLPMVPTLQVLTFMAFIRPFAASTAPVFLGLGRPDINLRSALVVLVTMVPLVFLLLDRGIVGVATADTIAYFVGFAYAVLAMNRLLPGIASKILVAVVRVFVPCAVMVVGVYLSKAPLERLLGSEPNLISLGVLIVIGGVLFSVTAFALQRELILETISLVVSVFRRRRRAGSGGKQATYGADGTVSFSEVERYDT